MVSFRVYDESGVELKENVVAKIPVHVLASLLNFAANAGVGKDGDVEGMVFYREVEDRGRQRAELTIYKWNSVGTYLWFID